MFFIFANAAVETGHDVSVALTTHEGAEFRIGGFATPAAAQAWIDREAYSQVPGVAPLRLAPQPSAAQRDRAA